MANAPTAFLITIALAGCATSQVGWAPSEPGCFPKGLAEALYVPEAADFGPTDVRIGRLPDSGRGPGLMVHFSRQSGGSIEPDGTPQLVVAVGDWERTCVAVIEEAACPLAPTAYQALAKLSIPIGFQFDEPLGITVLHGTQYFLASRDGERNPLYWSYYGPGHPLQRELSSILDAIQPCASELRVTFDANGI